MRDSRLSIGVASLLAIGSPHAQVKSIPAEGADGLTKEDVTFEPEYRERMRINFGQFAPAAPGTKPGSADPHNLEGIWIAGTQEAVGEAARASGSGGARGAEPAGGGARNDVAAATGATRALVQNLCRPGSPFTLGTPTQIIQTSRAVYILKVASMSQNGTSYRRIALSDRHPADLAPTYGGDAIGHWEGDTLVIETIGLKSAPGVRGDPGGGRAQVFTATTKAVERIRKIEGGLKLEDVLTLSDPAPGAESSRTRYVSYWRPDLKFIEAPCEEYADPLETEDSGPFTGGDEKHSGGPPPGGAGTPRPPAADFSGFWRPATMVTALRTTQGGTPPLTDEYKKIYAARQAAVARGDRSWDESATDCLPIGVPRVLAESPFEFAQTPQTTLFLYQWNRLQRPAPIRTAHVDFDRVSPYYLGHPFARWDGQTLVIDSIDFNDDTSLDASGLPHSDALHVTERYNLKDANTLAALVTIEDAKAFTRSWQTSFQYQRMSADARLSEDVCEDRQGIQPGRPARVSSSAP